MAKPDDVAEKPVVMKRYTEKMTGAAEEVNGLGTTKGALADALIVYKSVGRCKVLRRQANDMIGDMHIEAGGDAAEIVAELGKIVTGKEHLYRWQRKKNKANKDNGEEPPTEWLLRDSVDDMVVKSFKGSTWTDTAAKRTSLINLFTLLAFGPGRKSYEKILDKVTDCFSLELFVKILGEDVIALTTTEEITVDEPELPTTSRAKISQHRPATPQPKKKPLSLLVATDGTRSPATQTKKSVSQRKPTGEMRRPATPTTKEKPLSLADRPRLTARRRLNTVVVPGEQFGNAINAAEAQRGKLQKTFEETGIRAAAAADVFAKAQADLAHAAELLSLAHKSHTSASNDLISFLSQ